MTSYAKHSKKNLHFSFLPLAHSFIMLISHSSLTPSPTSFLLPLTRSTTEFLFLRRQWSIVSLVIHGCETWWFSIILVFIPCLGFFSTFMHLFSVSVTIFCRIIFLKLFIAGHLSCFFLCFATLPLVTWRDMVDAFVFFCFVPVILMSMIPIKLVVHELRCFGGELSILCNIKIIHIAIYCYSYMAMTSAVPHHTKCVLSYFDFSWIYLSNYFISVGSTEVQPTNT